MKPKIVLYLIVLVGVSLAFCAAQGNRNGKSVNPQKKAQKKNVKQPKPVELLLPAYNEKELLVEHKGHTLVYNTKYNTPKWVAWTLTSERAKGKIPRSTKFNADPLVPKSNRVEWYEYKESGYDRGHMCPSGDNKWDLDAMNECFYMSNICPQNRTLNDGWWKYLEDSCRVWARREGCLYIVCGPVFKAIPSKIGMQHAIAVPDGFFKVVLTLRKGHEKALGFYYRNDASRQPIKDAARTVDKIEKMTGIDFYPSLDDELEERLESTLSML